MAKNRKKKKTIELEEINVILKIPREAVALEVIASLLDENGKLIRVRTKLSASDICDRRQDFLDNVELGDDYDARFVITDEGREYLAGLLDGGEPK